MIINVSLFLNILLLDFIKAAGEKDWSFVKQMKYDYMIDVNFKNENERNALLEASNQGRLDVVQGLLNETNLDVQSIDRNGTNALHVACKNGHLGIVKVLRSRINVNTENNEGFSAIYLAVRNGHREVVEEMLKDDNVVVCNRTMTAASNRESIQAILVKFQGSKNESMLRKYI